MLTTVVAVRLKAKNNRPYYVTLVFSLHKLSEAMKSPHI